jgi:hypothetical protein
MEVAGSSEALLIMRQTTHHMSEDRNPCCNCVCRENQNTRITAKALLADPYAEVQAATDSDERDGLTQYRFLYVYF